MQTTVTDQKNIKIYNLALDYINSWNKEYPFGTFGCILRWVGLYFHKWDSVQIGDGRVTFFDKTIASYKLDHERGIIIFEFSPLHKDKYPYEDCVSKQNLVLENYDLFLQYVNTYCEKYNDKHSHLKKFYENSTK